MGLLASSRLTSTHELEFTGFKFAGFGFARLLVLPVQSMAAEFRRQRTDDPTVACCSFYV
jgi:hypothetical protein